MRRTDSRQVGRVILNVSEIETEGAYHIIETSGGCNEKMQVEECGSCLIKPDWLYNVTLILTDVLCSLRNTKIKKKAGYCVTLNFLCGDKTLCCRLTFRSL